MTSFTALLIAFLFSNTAIAADPFEACQTKAGLEQELCVSKVREAQALQEALLAKDLATRAIEALEQQEAATEAEETKSRREEKRAREAEIELEEMEEDAEFMRELREAGIQYRQDAPAPRAVPTTRTPTRISTSTSGVPTVTTSITSRGTDYGVVVGRRIEESLSPHQMCLHSLSSGIDAHVGSNISTGSVMIVALKGSVVTVPNAGLGVAVSPIYADLYGNKKLGLYTAMTPFANGFCTDLKPGETLQLVYLVDSGKDYTEEIDEDGDGVVDRVVSHPIYGGVGTGSVWVSYKSTRPGTKNWPGSNGLRSRKM